MDDYLRPFNINAETAHQLARELCVAFRQLAAESSVQFLATPVSESILRPPRGSEKGRYVTFVLIGSLISSDVLAIHICFKEMDFG